MSRNPFAVGQILEGKRVERWIDLHEPLHWSKPRHVIVPDLFDSEISDHKIDEWFAVMALCPQHTFQALTKRPERMAEYLHSKASPLDRNRWEYIAEIAAHMGKIVWDPRGSDPRNYYGVAGGTRGKDLSNRRAAPPWPLPNVWLGTSAENQETADARIPHLIRCPAAVRFLSLEPLLGPIDLTRWIGPWRGCSHYANFSPYSSPLEITSGEGEGGCVRPENVFADTGNPSSRPGAKSCRPDGCPFGYIGGIHQVIVGAESGPNARPCNVQWIRETAGPATAAGTAVFIKQLGARPFDSKSEPVCQFTSYIQWVNKAASWLGHYADKGSGGVVCVDARGRVCSIGADFMRARDGHAFPVSVYKYMRFRDPKGGDMSEWPADLRVREWPGGAQ